MKTRRVWTSPGLRRNSRQNSSYSEGATKLATKALRLSGLLHCSSKPCPLKVLAIANAGIACSTLVKGRYQTSSFRQIWSPSLRARVSIFARFPAVKRRLHTMQVTVGKTHIDRLVVHANHVLQQVPTHAFGKALQGKTLLGVGAIIHNQHCLYRIRRVVNIAQEWKRHESHPRPQSHPGALRSRNPP